MRRSHGRTALARRKSSTGLLRRWGRRLILLPVLAYLCAVGAIAVLRFVNPPFTMVHVQRRIEALSSGRDYARHYVFVPLRAIDENLRHAVIAAEDTRFFEHRGFDWKEMQQVVEAGDLRGASTLTQQLVKNLFFTTSRSALRKVLEAGLVWPAEFLLGKQRILELYLNVVEWGPGVYGAEAACRYHYKMPAIRIGRERAVRLAAILPNPRRRRPERMDAYSGVILGRMRAMGW